MSDAPSPAPRRIHVLVAEERDGVLHTLSRWIWDGPEPEQTEPVEGQLMGQAFLERTVKHLQREVLL